MVSFHLLRSVLTLPSLSAPSSVFVQLFPPLSDASDAIEDIHGLFVEVRHL